MNKRIAKNILIVFIISCSSLIYAQKGKSVLILKDSTRIHGIGEISGFSSIISVKFKNDSLKYRTYRSKEIIGIDILENNYYRKFRYKHIDGGKFPEILEIVSIDSLSLYVRIYEASVLSNSFLNEPINIGDETNPLNRNLANEIELANGDKIEIGGGIDKNIYFEINFERYSYYVGKRESDQVDHLYTKGLPFAKSFRKSMKKYFKNCPALIEKVENQEFSNIELWEVLYFYNRNCLKTSSE